VHASRGKEQLENTFTSKGLATKQFTENQGHAFIALSNVALDHKIAAVYLRAFATVQFAKDLTCFNQYTHAQRSSGRPKPCLRYYATESTC
jgi:hypothetical protein